MKCYATGHPISNVMMAAFAEGFEGEIVPPDKLLDGPAAMYGILRGTGELIHQCKWVQREFYYVDHGYFKRSQTPTSFDGFYRVTKNALQNIAPGIAPDNRWRALGCDCRPWRRDGRHVLVVPVSDAVGRFLGIDPRAWESSVVEEIKRYTNRPVKLLPGKDVGKSEDEKIRDLLSALKDCWCLVTLASNAAMLALQYGVPVIALGESAALPASWGFEHIEKPVWKEREPLFHHLAYQQFTLSEIRDGTARRLLEAYG